jgi:hypothetical protein
VIVGGLLRDARLVLLVGGLLGAGPLVWAARDVLGVLRWLVP